MSGQSSYLKRIGGARNCSNKLIKLIIGEVIVGGAIDGKSIVSGTIVGEAIVGEAIVGGDGAVLAKQGSNLKKIAGACSGRDELGGQHNDLEEIAGICSGSNKLRR